MGMVLLQAANILAGPANFSVPAGQYSSFLIRGAGVNAGGATEVIASMGLVTGTWRGGAWMSVRFDDLNILSRHTGGVMESASAIGAGFAFSCRIKSSYGLDGNIFDVTDDDNVKISVDLSGITAAVVASGTVSLFGVLQDGAQAYVPRLSYYVHSVPASGSVPEQIQVDNVSHLMMTPLTNLARLQVLKDNVPYCQLTTAEALCLSNNDWQTEAAAETTVILIPLQRSGMFSEALSDDVRLTLDAGAGGAVATRVMTIGLDPTPDVLARSRATLDSKVTVKRDRKSRLRKDRAVKVDQAVQG